jgi:hypothetical protein
MLVRNISGEDIELISPLRLEIKAGTQVGVRDSLINDPMIRRLVRQGLVSVQANRTRFQHINVDD